MKYISSILLMLYAMCCFFPETIEASSTMWERLSGPVGGSLQSISVIGNTLIAHAGNGGVSNNFYRSTDLGETWTEIGQLPQRSSTKILALVDSTVIISSQNKPYRSVDNGKSWSRIVIDTLYPDVTPEVANALNVFFASFHRDSVLYRSEDLGLTWKKIKMANNCAFINMEISDTRIFFHTEQRISQSLDSGRTWYELTPPIQGTEIVTGAISMQGRLIVCTTKGVLISDNDGVDWTRSTKGLPENSHLYGLKVSGKNIYTSFYDTAFLRSSDNGTSWVQLNLPGPSSLKELSVETDLITFMHYRCTPDGDCQRVVSTSINAGESWHSTQLKNKTVDGYVTAILNGYIFCNNGDGIYRSSDTGKTFIKCSNGIYNLDINNVASDFDNLFVATNLGLYRSSDNGATWTLLKIDSTPFFITAVYNIGKAGNHLYAAQFSDIFSLQDESSVWQKENVKLALMMSNIYSPFIPVGENIYYYANVKNKNDTAWNRFDTTGRPTYITDFTMCDSVLFVSGFNGIFRYTDNGDTWVQVKSSIINCLSSSSNVLYAGLNNDSIILSYDKGNSWNVLPHYPSLQKNVPGCSDLSRKSESRSIVAYKNYLFIAYNADRFDCTPANSFYSSDNGNTWQSLSDQIPYVVNRFQIFDDKLYASTQFGGLWRLNLSELPIVQQPGQFYHQAGPFSYEITGMRQCQTRIVKINLFSRNRVRANLYSITGKKAALLVDGYYEPGNYHFPLGDSNLSQGCYILSLCIGQQVRNIALQLVR